MQKPDSGGVNRHSDIGESSQQLFMAPQMFHVPELMSGLEAAVVIWTSSGACFLM